MITFATMISRINFNLQQFGHYLDDVPYNTTMAGLYDAEYLYGGFDPEHPETLSDTYDSKVYQHFLTTGKVTQDPLESISRSLHDHFIVKGINQLTDCYDQKKVVGVMGGSAMLRTDTAYRNIALVSKRLTEHGTLMVSGGGSGAMEATSLGGLMAGRTVEELDDALSILAKAPSFADRDYLSVSFRVLEKYPQNNNYECLSIPTWLYGHEPTSPFASKIAKLFQNSVREDLLLTIAYGGLIFAPGSAGTMQEIFQEAVQNHYLTLGISSPMVFLDSHFWTEDMPAYTMLRHLSETGRYKNLLLSITDSPDQAADIIEKFQNE